MNENAPHGPCCACEGQEGVRNIMCLDFEGPEGFTGWGCFLCQLPPRGAVAMLCDRCAETDAELRFICGGELASQGVRVSLKDYVRVPFGHKLEKHPEVVRQ